MNERFVYLKLMSFFYFFVCFFFYGKKTLFLVKLLGILMARQNIFDLILIVNP